MIRLAPVFIESLPVLMISSQRRKMTILKYCFAQLQLNLQSNGDDFAIFKHAPIAYSTPALAA